MLLYLLAFAAAHVTLAGSLPAAWSAPLLRVLWPVGLLWLGARYADRDELGR